LPWALVALVAARGETWAWELFAVTVAARLAVGLTSAVTVLGDTQALRDLFLVPVRDLIAPVVWALGLVGNRIFWRGEVFHLKKGRLERIADDDTVQQELSRLPRP
jgi:ceramide glucosyltransferase